MPSDYASIREQNIKEYGEGTRHLAFLGNLYSDRTHFILELLQNAEDARASWVKFDLFDDRLEIRHNGRPFDTEDVIGICGVDASTKSTDLTTIGRFGVGFKSVYAYTTSPHIYSGDESFVIRDFVRPQVVPTRADVGSDETLQVFPFNHPEVGAPAAHQQIQAALHRLDASTLLFLRHVQSVSTQSGGRIRELSRRPISSTPPSVETRDLIDGTMKTQRWWLFERAHTYNGQTGMPVQIAFKLRPTADGKSYEPVRLATSPLVVFFPTEKETNLGFLLQGPFRTTPARDNIPAEDEWNVSLVGTAAALVLDTLHVLKKQKLLTMRALGALATRSEVFPAGSMFHRIHSHVADALRTEALIPTARGSFARGSDIRIPVNRIEELITDGQLTTLVGAPGSLRWIGDSDDVDDPDLLDTYFRMAVNIPSVTFETVVAKLNSPFLEAQTDRWIAKLYSHLHRLPSLWRPQSSWQRRQKPHGIVGDKPIIRLDDGTHIAPFDENGEPTAYLPINGAASEFVTVARSVTSDKQARDFLRALGLCEPDAAEEVLRFLIPRYDAGNQNLRASGIQEDWHTIDRAMSSATDKRRKQLIDMLGNAPVVRCTDSFGRHCFRSPRQSYWRDGILEEHFAPDPEFGFADEVYDPWKQLLSVLGVASRIRVTTRRPTGDGHVVLAKDHGFHKRGLNGFDPDIKIDGLLLALEYPTSIRSEHIWNSLLVPRAQKLSGTVETATRKDYGNSTRKELDAGILTPLRTRAWLPTKEGTFARPQELSTEDLPDSFTLSDILADVLGMQTSALHQASTDLGIPPDALQFLQDNPSVAADLAKKQSKAVALQSASSQESFDDSSTFAEAMGESFNRPGSTGMSASWESATPSDTHGSVPNVGFRRERVSESITQIRHSAPNPQPATVTIHTRVEARDEVARQFLLEQYGGNCQICSHTFPRRNGEPYFEGVHLAERKVGRHTDRPGGMLCLCARCSSMFQHGSVSSIDVKAQVQSWQAKSEGGSGECGLRFDLCGEPVFARFTEKHFLDLQVLLQSDLMDLAE